jgi:diguanylate cyclase (GGDEF)-like protein
VLPEAAFPDALGRAEELVCAIRERRIWSEGRAPISASAGVVTFPDDGTETLQLLRAADAALYRAKAQGGDRVESGRAILKVSS